MRRGIIIGFLVSLLIVGITSTIVFAQEKINLVFRQQDPEGLIGRLKDVFTIYEQTHPNIRVEFQTVPWSEAFKQLIRETQVGGGPDLCQVAYVWARDLGIMGATENLTPYIKRDFSPEKINDWMHWEIGEYKGNIYGVPWTTDSLGILYREDLFKEAGLDLPDTWTELLATAMLLSKDKDGDGVIDQWGLGMSGAQMWFWVAVSIWTHGLEIVEQDPKTGKWQAGFNNLAGKNIVRYWKDFIKFGASPEGIISIPSWTSPELINGLRFGDFAMIFSWPRQFVIMKEQDPKLPVKGYYMPGAVHRYTMTGGRELAINKYSKHKEEAWELLKFLTKKEIFEKYYPEIPPQRSIIKTMDWDIRQVFAEMILTGRTYIHEIRSPAPVDQLWDIFNREFSALLSGEKTVDETHKSLVNKVNEALKRGIK